MGRTEQLAAISLYELVLATEEHLLTEFAEGMRTGAKSRVLVEHLLALRKGGRAYSHCSAVASVYGVQRGDPLYRRRYLALMRLNDSVALRLRRYLHSAGADTPTTVEHLLTEAERLYIRARSLFIAGRYAEAGALLSQAVVLCTPGRCDELLAFQILSLRQFVADKLSDTAAPPEPDIATAADALARAVCNLFWQYQFFGSAQLRTTRSVGQLEGLEEQYRLMAAHPLMKHYTPVFDKFALDLRRNLSIATDSTVGTVVRERIAGLSEECRQFGLSFFEAVHLPHRSALNPTEWYDRGVSFLAADDLESAEQCFAVLADYYRSGGGNYEHMQSMYISILFAAGRLERIPEHIRRLLLYATERESVFYAALARYYTARYAVYGELGNPAAVIGDILHFEQLCAGYPLGLANVLRVKAKYYFRMGDAEALQAVAAQMRSRRFAALNVGYIRRFIAFLLDVLDYRATSAPALWRSLCRRRRRLLALQPGERYARGYLADWIGRYCAVPDA